MARKKKKHIHVPTSLQNKTPSIVLEELGKRGALADEVILFFNNFARYNPQFFRLLLKLRVRVADENGKAYSLIDTEGTCTVLGLINGLLREAGSERLVRLDVQPRNGKLDFVGLRSTESSVVAKRNQLDEFK
jgi:hypothetical protein